ncbi:MAG: uracil phosphoribosyltransferase [Pseudomonadota bacterium]
MTREEALRLPMLHVATHPLIEHKLTLMRALETPVAQFRQLAREVAMLLAYEVTHDLPLDEVEIETPLQPMRARRLSGKKLCLVSILRAGNGLLEGMLDLIPSARVGHIGLYRDPATLQPVEYYYKVPSDIDERQVIIVDPMLATANSAVAAIDRVRRDGPTDIRFVCLLAAPEGIERVTTAHPEVPIYTAALDDGLNAKGYIMPGLGDAGDRIYGTK